MGLVPAEPFAGATAVVLTVGREPSAAHPALIQDLGVNLAGAEVVMHMNERMRQMEYEMQRLRQRLQSYPDRILPVVADGEGER